ncbi:MULTISPECIES: hypothetical protein [Chryseobacterium]|uniref:Uncharacterized protein n=1 Tax=Chryseobacterium camelliae TaxID=1265445 RepID=A0ABU0TNY7_9FLAO|nr:MULTISPECIES: hypothetical protein [Chryseobacterium]MDT3407391.1 hypothetical protein [Pseudacidovorax intermedius]MDQ1098760.1 hypothetical protein [Chryseobacterium camelliae]MDQ1102684.1 hypothetical protein [Chryseobacterium sp. SORGH_AS_1048]MDR6086113.1 hypothetical protein [Chryseobacterium sp. SORGH_AS_0909]MDR6130482.1 hypothetical protein [Chryseobacterium sp. SORGH_AS_1175]
MEKSILFFIVIFAAVLFWKVHHQIGKVFLLNQIINEYLTSGFFKNHDFVAVENLKTQEAVIIDAAIYDYFRINRLPM